MSLHERIAKVLGWPLSDVYSMSLLTLRELVKPIDAKLYWDITVSVRNAAY